MSDPMYRLRAVTRLTRLLLILAPHGRGCRCPRHRRAEAPIVPPSVLPPRQLQALGLRAHGLTIEEAAGQMGIARSTAKHHCTAALARLDAGSVEEAYITLGWLRPPTEYAPAGGSTPTRSSGHSGLRSGALVLQPSAGVPSPEGSA